MHETFRPLYKFIFCIILSTFIVCSSRFSDPINPLQKPLAPSKVSAYEGATEVQTMEDLEELLSDPDDMKMQALLVRERILGPAHPDTSYYIRYRGAVYADMGDFDRCIALWMYALDMQMNKLDPLSPMTQSSLLSFAELFSFMMGNGRTRSICLVQFSDIYSIFSKAITELERGRGVLMDTKTLPSERDTQNYSKIVTIIMHLMSLICRLSSKLTEDEEFQFKKLVFQLIKLEPRNSNGQTLLHLAANHETTSVGKYPVCDFPCVKCIELLTELDAAIDCVDLNGNTALHVASMQKTPDADIMLSLLKAGAHIDTVNGEDKEAMDYLVTRKKALVSTIMPQNFTSLQCLAAKALRKYKIRYRSLPHELQQFTDKH